MILKGLSVCIEATWISQQINVLKGEFVTVVLKRNLLKLQHLTCSGWIRLSGTKCCTPAAFIHNFCSAAPSDRINISAVENNCCKTIKKKLSITLIYYFVCADTTSSLLCSSNDPCCGLCLFEPENKFERFYKLKLKNVKRRFHKNKSISCLTVKLTSWHCIQSHWRGHHFCPTFTCPVFLWRYVLHYPPVSQLPSWPCSFLSSSSHWLQTLRPEK